MTVVLPHTETVIAELRQLAPDVKAKLRAERHPEARDLMVLTGRSWAADQAIAALVKRVGEVRWQNGRWIHRKAQLRLPGFA